MAWRTGCVAIVLTAMLGCQVSAQTFQEGRAPLIDGQVQDVKKELSSLEGPPGGRIAVIYGLPTARTIKLRLEHVAGSSVASGVAVLVRDAGSNEEDGQQRRKTTLANPPPRTRRPLLSPNPQEGGL